MIHAVALVLLLAGYSRAEYYTVQPGDTFSSIARSQRCFYEGDLREANPGIDAHMLLQGAVIEIPIVVPARYRRLSLERDALNGRLVRLRGAFVRMRNATHDISHTARFYDRQKRAAERKLETARKKALIGLVGWLIASVLLGVTVFLWGNYTRTRKQIKRLQTQLDASYEAVRRLNLRFADQVRIGKFALGLSPEQFADFHGLLAQLLASGEHYPEAIERLLALIRSQGGATPKLVRVLERPPPHHRPPRKI